ncbi:MAG: LamG domain-containing protein [Gammaproteobacteria bacterium]|nr:LamG domain-containing protein [Gammaproteobacteria bacterium]
MLNRSQKIYPIAEFRNGLLLIVTLLLFLTGWRPAFAAPGDTLFNDNFESGFGNWTAAGAGDASIGTETANSGTSSMRIRWDTETSTSNAINTAVPAAQFDVWIRRGDDAFSENPEAGENLTVEYYNNVGTWVTLETFDGGGTAGEILPRTYYLTGDALHAGFRIRFSLAGGSGVDWDYWHVDDTVVTEIAVPPPFGVGGCDNFESGFTNWTTAGAGDSGIGTYTFNSASSSMYLRWNTVTTTSIAIDYSGATTAQITAWVQRGDDTFSENPEAGEDLTIQYLNNVGTWITLETFPGDGTQGETFSRSYTLAADAIHANFQLRFNLAAGSGTDYDYWHIDDVCFLSSTSVGSVAQYSMEETVWNGTAGEVTDESGNNLNGQSNNGAFTTNTNPAIAGDPGSCRYGVFDGTNQYLEVADNALLDIGDELTVAVWINPDALPGALMTILSKDENYEFHLTNTGQINWWWQSSGGATRTITTTGTALDANDGTAPNNGWYHIAIVYSQTSASQTIFINGTARAMATYNEALINNNDPMQIGSDQNFAGRYFDGLIDEVYVYHQALTTGEITALMNTTRPCSSAAIYYAMDEAAWSGAGSVVDSSGNGIDGNPQGTVSTASTTPAISGSPGTCGYGVFPNNTAAGTIDAVDSTITPGATGAITFWYNSSLVWDNNQDRMLLDASANLGNNGADKHFVVGIFNNNGALRFELEDSGDTNSIAETGAQTFPAGTWVHIGITWDLGNNLIEVYLNGSLSASSNTNLNGTPGNWNSLYIGDNRDTNVGGGAYTGNSANGLIDELRYYNTAISAGRVAIDMAETHSCASTDHFNISHDGTAVTCQAEPITIEAHLSDHTIDATYTGTINLNTSTNHGDWTVITGTNAINNGVADDGAATYLFDALDLGTVVLGLKNTHAETLNINVSDGVISELTGSAEDANLVFAESGFQFLADTVASNIGNQIGGKPSNVAPGNQTLELQAIRTSPVSGQCEAALQGNVNIELAFECRNPTSCTANQVNINGGTPTNIAGNALGPIGSWTNVGLDFGDATDTTATFVMNYPDVGQLQLYARYNMPLDDGSATPSGNYMLGNSNAFVVRPFGFYVNVTGNPAASEPGGSAFTQAGANFTVNSTAVLWDAADDSDNDGIPDGHEAADSDETNNTNLGNNTAALNYGQETTTEDIALSSTLDQPVGGTDPNLSGTTTITSFTNGAGNSAAVTHNEVGIIEIAANHADGNYLGVTGAIGKSGYVGRFVPDHFALSAGMISDRVTLSCAPAATFTYMEEDQRLEFTLTAQNVSNATTTNYRGAFAYLDMTAPANLNIGAIDTLAPTLLSTRITEVSSSGAWVNGVANPVFATVRLDRAAAVDGPYTDLNWGVAPVDSDNVQMGSYNLDVNNDTTNDHALIANNEVRFGRAFVESVSGSELLPLTLPVHLEYYSGSQFIRNTNDNCSTYNSTDLTFSNRVGLPANPAASGSGTFINGTFDPANPMTLNSSSNSGSIDATLTVLGYLQFDWDGDGNFDNNPAGKATFGIFDINSRQIYTREVY